MPAYRHGDLFAMPLGAGKFVAGRILLDVTRQCVRPGLIQPGSPLSVYGGGLLVEIYREVAPEPIHEVSDILVPGVFVDADALKSGAWPLRGNVTADPTRLEFPETLINYSGKARFRRGEIDLPLPLGGDDVDHFQVYATIESSAALPDICLNYLGLKHLIEHDYADAMTLKQSDLRFTDFRAAIYEMLGLDATRPYFEVSRTFGLDPRRFY